MAVNRISQEIIDKAEKILRAHPEGLTQSMFLRKLGYGSHAISILVPLTDELPIFIEDDPDRDCSYIFYAEDLFRRSYEKQCKQPQL